jgi:5-bromo-4-chloroindolyl phosphate hydrolysis protein
MNLESFFYLALSIQAVILSLFFLSLIGFLIYLSIVVKRTSRKLKEVAEEGLETAHDAKKYVNKMGKAAMDYLVIKSLGSINRKRK